VLERDFFDDGPVERRSPIEKERLGCPPDGASVEDVSGRSRAGREVRPVAYSEEEIPAGVIGLLPKKMLSPSWSQVSSTSIEEVVTDFAINRVGGCRSSGIILLS